MEWRNRLQKLLFPSVWVTLFLTVGSTVALIIIFVNGCETSPVAYVVYVIAFYTLTILCLICWKTIPRYYKNVKNKVYENRYASRYFTDVAYKTHVNLYRSLAINMLYAIVNAVSAIVYSTHWFAIFAIYYTILVIMRFLLVCYVGKNKNSQSRMGELKRARLCTGILLTVNLALSGAVLMMIYFQRSFEYPGFLIYVMALYTFCITIAAVRDIVRYRKYNNPLLSASNIIKLAAALVSMLLLETAMLSEFGADTAPEAKRIMIMATGAGIAVVIVTLAIISMIRTTKEIREIRRRTANGE